MSSDQLIIYCRTTLFSEYQLLYLFSPDDFLANKGNHWHIIN